MCVIIARNPGIEIPHDKLESACAVNPDGYGLSVVDRGKLVTIKEVHKQGNPVKKIIERLEDAKEHTVFLHLRYKTHGPINEDNCHPFNVANVGGLDINMMHNGVLSDFTTGTDKLSDTARFNELILKPLVNKMLPFHLAEKTSILDDETLLQIVEKYCGSSNKIVLYDNNGHHMIANRKLGVEYEGWWASNDYSFNRHHREPVTRSYYGGPYNNGGKFQWSDRDLDDNLPWPDNSSKASSRNVQTTVAKDSSKVKEAGKAIANSVKTAEYAASQVNPTILPPDKRETFVEIAGIVKLSQLCVMEQEDIEQMVNDYPEATTILIMDLLHELYMAERNKKPGVADV